MSLINGVVIGIVTKVNNNGTVKVKFPWLPDEPETDWIRIATTMAGNKRGTFFMPEKKDEVLVAFEHGHTNHPYVVGFLWNGVDKPPSDDINTSVRRVQTVSGLILEFDDNENSKSITIKSADKREIKLDEKGESITIISGENTITMDKVGISIKTTDSINIEGKSIALSAVEKISLKGSEISITATRSLVATGKPIHLNP